MKPWLIDVAIHCRRNRGVQPAFIEIALCSTKKTHLYRFGTTMTEFLVNYPFKMNIKTNLTQITTVIFIYL